MKFIDLTGQKFGKLKVIKRAPNNKENQIQWVCECDCGANTVVNGGKLKSGHTRSCGCLNGRGKGYFKADESWLEDLSGKKFGRLTVISFSGNMPSGGTLFLCQCVCGKLKKVCRQSLIRGTTVSCGCYNKEILHSQRGKKNPAYRHGYTRKHPLWDVYHHMIGRCYRINDKSYRRYGKRGIVICRIWKNEIVKFIKWALNHGYKEGLEIDRINNNGPYAPWNCQFITGKENKMKMHEQKNRYMPS